METISLTIPLDRRVIESTIEYLNDLVIGLSTGSRTEESVLHPDHIATEPNLTTGLVAVVPPPLTPELVLDSTGLPWDSRIHASTKTQTKQDAWKKRKGVDAETVAQVEAELRAVLAATPESPMTPQTQAPPPPKSTAVVTETPADFAQFMAMFTAGDETFQARVVAAVQAQGLDSIQLVAINPTIIPAIMESLQ